MSEQELEQEQEEEQSEEVNVAEQVREVFDEQVGNDEDDVKLAMIGAGATFKNVARMYNAFMIDAGLALSKEDKTAHVAAALEGRDFSEEEGYDAAIVALVDDDKGINERSAGGLLRAYAKKNEVDIYTKPKSEGGGRSGFVQSYYDYLRANPTVSEKDADAWIRDVAANKASANNLKMVPFFQKIRELVNAVAAQ